VETDFVREGLLLGVVWMAVNVGIDVPLMLSPSPMQMSLGEYMADIGLTYVLIPVVTMGIGLVRAQGRSGSSPGDAV